MTSGKQNKTPAVCSAWSIATIALLLKHKSLKHKNCDNKALSLACSSVEACIGRQQKTGRQTGVPCMLTTCPSLVIHRLLGAIQADQLCRNQPAGTARAEIFNLSKTDYPCTDCWVLCRLINDAKTNLLAQ